MFFFFQAEDGIRDLTVTGVQTCALPIWLPPLAAGAERGRRPGRTRARRRRWLRPRRRPVGHAAREIGRASCRGRGEISVVAVSFKKKKKREGAWRQILQDWCGTGVTVYM